MSNPKTQKIGWILILFLSGCASDPDQSIENLVKQSRAQKTAVPAPLPEFTNNVACHYQAAHLRNPFEWYDSAGSTQLSAESNLQQPREPLECYPLESLKMIGYLERNQIFWGLVKDKQGMIHKVFVGQAIGQNGGTIKQIHESGIEIEENNAMNEKRQFTLALSAE